MNEPEFLPVVRFMFDVLDLQQDAELDDDKGASEADGKTGDGTAGGETKQATEEEKVWVERDKCVSAAIRAAEAALETFKVKGKTQLTRQLQAEREILQDADETFNKSFGGEIKMLRTRLEAGSIQL